MKPIDKIAAGYITLWNERDRQRRLDLLASHWTSDARYTDPLTQGAGAAEISDLIGAVHERFPGFRFALAGKPDGYGDIVRFSWTLGPDQGEAPIQGTDIVVCKGERIASVTGFLDRVPAAA